VRLSNSPFFPNNSFLPRRPPRLKMETVAILGVAAASLQFAEQGINIARVVFSTLSAVKDATLTTRHHLESVDQLICVLQAILQHQVFQTASVETILRSTLRDITRLQNLLLKQNLTENLPKWRKWSRSMISVLQSDDIDRSFARLERQKSALAICMQTIDS
jgi:hypothetical protein